MSDLRTCEAGGKAGAGEQRGPGRESSSGTGAGTGAGRSVRKALTGPGPADARQGPADKWSRSLDLSSLLGQALVIGSRARSAHGDAMRHCSAWPDRSRGNATRDYPPARGSRGSRGSRGCRTARAHRRRRNVSPLSGGLAWTAGEFRLGRSRSWRAAVVPAPGAGLAMKTRVDVRRLPGAGAQICFQFTQHLVPLPRLRPAVGVVDGRLECGAEEFPDRGRQQIDPDRGWTRGERAALLVCPDSLPGQFRN
jgi:hypothetical protein